MSLPYFVMALGVLNVLLVSSGLLLVYFAWLAARRREFLYLYFSEEKPGINYFATARRRRAQYTRFLVVFSLLFVREYLVTSLYAASGNLDAWKAWNGWPDAGTGIAAPPLDVRLQIVLYCLEPLVLAFLSWGFLWDPQREGRSPLDVMASGFMVVWLAFVALSAGTVLGHATPVVVSDAIIVTRCVLIVAVIAWALSRPRDPARNSRRVVNTQPSAEPGTLAIALAIWLVGAVAHDTWHISTVAPLSHAFAYSLLLLVIARGVFQEYEAMETSRHRLGRERQVIFTFLQRIGAAFTEALEVQQVLRIVLETALETSEASAGAIYLYDASSKMLQEPLVLGFFPPMYVDTPAALSPHRTEELEEEMKHQSFHLGEGIMGQVAQKGQTHIVEDVSAEGIMLGTTTDYMRNRSMIVVPLRIRDEPLGVMALLNKQRGSFGLEDRTLLEALATQGALSIHNAVLTHGVREQERLQRELQIAKDIQQRLLPEHCPIVPGFEIAARGSSANEVGGDYYDFFWVDEDHLGIVVADVSGKGVHAALVVAMMRSAFRTQARNNPDVRDVLARVNEGMSQDLRRDMFVTCVYGILEISTKRFSWARAGHEPLIVAHAAAPTDVLSPDGFALGLIGSPEFQEMLEVKTIELHSGDRLLMFTDGLTEAMNSNGEEFGMERILQVVDHVNVTATLPANGYANGHVNGHANGHAGRNGAMNSGSDKPKAHGAGQPLPKNAQPATVAASQTDEALNLRLSESCTADTNPDGSPQEPEDPDDLKFMERAVENHVGDAPQSDDLTIVYLAAK